MSDLAALTGRVDAEIRGTRFVALWRRYGIALWQIRPGGLRGLVVAHVVLLLRTSIVATWGRAAGKKLLLLVARILILLGILVSVRLHRVRGQRRRALWRLRLVGLVTAREEISHRGEPLLLLLVLLSLLDLLGLFRWRWAGATELHDIARKPSLGFLGQWELAHDVS